MWPMTLEVAMALAHDRRNELLETARRLRLADSAPNRRAGWQRILGRLLVRLGDRLTAWGAEIKRETAELHEPSPMPTTSRAR